MNQDGWLVIPHRMIQDKPLPEGYLWCLEEDFQKYASIRVTNSQERKEEIGQETSLVLGLKKDRRTVKLMIANTEGAHKEELLDATLEEAVSIMYARFMLGEGEPKT